MDINNFLNTVKEQIKYKPIRKNIEEELKCHIEDAKEDFVSKGVLEVINIDSYFSGIWNNDSDFKK